MRARVLAPPLKGNRDVPGFEEDAPRAARSPAQRAGFEMREVANGHGGTGAKFEGFASVTDAPYVVTDRLRDYTETIRKDAFSKTLSQNPDVCMLVNHDGMPLARAASNSTLKLREGRAVTVASLYRSDPHVPDGRARIGRSVRAGSSPDLVEERARRLHA